MPDLAVMSRCLPVVLTSTTLIDPLLIFHNTDSARGASETNDNRIRRYVECDTASIEPFGVDEAATICERVSIA